MLFDVVSYFQLTQAYLSPKMYNIVKDTIVLDDIFHNYFKESLFEDVIAENCSSGSYESIKETFTVCRNLKQPPPVLKSLLKKGTYDVTNYQAIKNEHKVVIPLGISLQQTIK